MPSETGADAYEVENKYFTPVGTGKFKAETMVADKLTLTKNDDYHGDKPYVENVSVTFVKIPILQNIHLRQWSLMQ